MKQRGFTLIELLFSLAIVFIFLAVIGTAIGHFLLNTPGQTEARAKEAATQWVADNKITVQRMSCSFDSDGDGYGTCTVVTPSGEKIFLQCVSSWFAQLTGAQGCKEVDTLIKFNSSGVPTR